MSRAIRTDGGQPVGADGPISKPWRPDTMVPQEELDLIAVCKRKSALLPR